MIGQLKDVCIAQGQHMFYIKATIRQLTPNALLALLKVASDDYYDILEESKECSRYFPSGLIKHFEVRMITQGEMQMQSSLTAICTFHFYGEVLLNDPEKNSGSLYCLADAIEVLLGNMA